MLIFNNETGQLEIGRGRAWLEGDKAWMVNNAGVVVPAPMQVNALLRKDEWVSFDRTVIQVASQRLSGVSDLRSAGLIYNAGDLGSSVAEWYAAGDMTDAEINMSGMTRPEKDKVALNLAGVPIPIIRKDFDVPLRALLASRRNGAGIDTISAAVAARKVAEASESLLFNGTAITIAGYTVYGYTNHPDRATGALNYDWANPATTGANILTDVRRMVAALEARRFYGPYRLYVGGNYWAPLGADYSTAKGDNTVLQRLLAERSISGVSVSDVLGDDEAVLVQMTSDVVDLAVAQDVTTLQWENGDGMLHHFAVLAAWAPRIKVDYAGNAGIAHFTFASA